MFHKDSTYQALTPVFEKLPEAMLKAEIDPECSTNYPLLIGLGPRAERIIEDLRAIITIPVDVGIYRTNRLDTYSRRTWLNERLEKTAVVMLLIDPDDQIAWEGAKYWAQRLIENKIKLSLAVVLNTGVIHHDINCWTDLGIPVIETHTSPQNIAESKFIQALLLAFPLCKPALFTVNLSDLQSILSMGSKGWTTAVYSRSHEEGGLALARAFMDLPVSQPSRVMAWLTTGNDLTLGEFDAIVRPLSKHLDKKTAILFSPFLDSSYAKGEVLISLTVFGN